MTTAAVEAYPHSYMLQRVTRGRSGEVGVIAGGFLLLPEAFTKTMNAMSSLA
jgi:hypothetical protein